MPLLDVRRVIETLARHDVEYLLVGGVAARFHGPSARRRTSTWLSASSEENLDRLAAALRELGAFLRVGGLTDSEAKALPVQIDPAALGRMEVSTWRTDAGDLDVLTGIPDMTGERLPFEQLEGRSLTTTFGEVAIRLAGLADIIESKRFADRDKDREALPELERLLAEESE